MLHKIQVYPFERQENRGRKKLSSSIKDSSGNSVAVPSKSEDVILMYIPQMLEGPPYNLTLKLVCSSRMAVLVWFFTFCKLL